MAKRNKKSSNSAPLPSSSFSPTAAEPTTEPTLQLYNDAIQKQFEQFFKTVTPTPKTTDQFAVQLTEWELSPLECTLRIVQSIVNCLPTEKNLMEFVGNLDFGLFAQTFVQMGAPYRDETLQSVFSLLKPLLASSNVSIAEHQRVHRNVAALLAKFLTNPFRASFTRLPEETISQTFKYLANFLEHPGVQIRRFTSEFDCELVCWAIIAAERLLGLLNRIGRHLLAVEDFKASSRTWLKGLTKFSAVSVIDTQSGKKKFAFEQLGLCALSLFASIEANEPNLYIGAKIFSDGLTVRVDSPEQPTTIRSAFAVTSGVYFYEVTVHQTGEYTFGWSTKEMRKDEVMLSFNGYTLKSAPKEARLPHFCQGDIIGCLLDTVQKKATFYLNGHPTEQHHGKYIFYMGENESVLSLSQLLGLTPPKIGRKNDFSSQPYYPTAILHPHMQADFNFGQKAFVNGPKSVKYLSAHSVSGHDPRRYCLLRPQYLPDGSVYFAEEYTVGLFEESNADPAQKGYTKWVTDLEAAVRKDPTAQNESTFTQLNTRFKQLLIQSPDPNCFLRLTVALIKSLGSSLSSDDHLDKLYNWTVYYFSTNARAITRRLSQGQLLTLLGPTIRQSARSAEDILKQRTACLLLLIQLENFSLATGKICERVEIVDFLERLLTENEDKRSQLYALNCLHFSSESRSKLFRPLAFVNRKQLAASLSYLAKPLEELNYETLRRLKSNRAYLRYKLAHCAQWYLNEVLERETVTPPNEGTIATLNRKSATSGLTLSSDCLSPRGDIGWQSVSSTMSAQSSLLMGAYHFEVLLLTDGPMKFGWMPRSNDPFKPTPVQMMAYLNLNAYHETADQVELKAKKRHEKAPPLRWSVGDMVRCEVNFTQSAILFYLNEQLVKVQSFLSIGIPLYATIALGPHQQVVVNFGQAPFSNEQQLLGPTGELEEVKPPIGEFYTMWDILAKERKEEEKRNQKDA